MTGINKLCISYRLSLLQYNNIPLLKVDVILISKSIKYFIFSVIILQSVFFLRSLSLMHVHIQHVPDFYMVLTKLSFYHCSWWNDCWSGYWWGRKNRLWRYSSMQTLYVVYLPCAKMTTFFHLNWSSSFKGIHVSESIRQVFNCTGILWS